MLNTGLVLSGGGARGIAHIGVIKALDELGINIHAISGVSAGAIFGAFYASGLSIEAILKIAEEGEVFDFMNIHPGKLGLFKSESLKKSLDKNLTVKNIEDLFIPLFIAATDFYEAKITYFTHGNLTQALLASSSIPVLFQPAIIENKMFFDGGLLNNFPVEPLIEKCRIIIGVHVNPVNTANREFNIKTLIERSFILAISATVREKIRYCSVFIEPSELYRFNIFNLGHAREIAGIGYEATMQQKDKLLSFYS